MALLYRFLISNSIWYLIRWLFFETDAWKIQDLKLLALTKVCLAELVKNMSITFDEYKIY